MRQTITFVNNVLYFSSVAKSLNMIATHLQTQGLPRLSFHLASIFSEETTCQPRRSQELSEAFLSCPCGFLHPAFDSKAKMAKRLVTFKVNVVVLSDFPTRVLHFSSHDLLSILALSLSLFYHSNLIFNSFSGFYITLHCS